jgi:hypothetical protein
MKSNQTFVVAAFVLTVNVMYGAQYKAKHSQPSKLALAISATKQTAQETAFNIKSWPEYHVAIPVLVCYVAGYCVVSIGEDVSGVDTGLGKHLAGPTAFLTVKGMNFLYNCLDRYHKKLESNNRDKKK